MADKPDEALFVTLRDGRERDDVDDDATEEENDETEDRLS